jgi:hypothetical protein
LIEGDPDAPETTSGLHDGWVCAEQLAHGNNAWANAGIELLPEALCREILV